MIGADEQRLGWTEQEVRIAKLPAGWQFRVDKGADGTPVLMGIKTRDGAPSPSVARRAVTRGLGGSDDAR